MSDNNIGINVGHSKEAICEAKIAILEIMRVSVDKEVIKAGLDTLVHLTQIRNTTITGCNFKM